MVLGLELASVLAGAGGGFLAALLGNRYFFYLELREAHRKDLTKHVIEPWREYAQEQMGYLDYSGLGRYPAVSRSDGSYQFRTGDHGFPTNVTEKTEDAFPLTEVLWDSAKSHWNDTAQRWDSIQKELEELDDEVRAILRNLEERLPERGNPETKYPAHTDRLPVYGRRRAVMRVWAALVAQADPTNMSPIPFKLDDRGSEKAVSRDAFYLVEGDSEPVEDFLEKVHSIVRDEGLIEEVHAVHAGAAAIRDKLDRFSAHLRILGLQKGFPQTCTLCPPLLGRSRDVPPSGD